MNPLKNMNLDIEYILQASYFILLHILLKHLNKSANVFEFKKITQILISVKMKSIARNLWDNVKNLWKASVLPCLCTYRLWLVTALVSVGWICRSAGVTWGTGNPNSHFFFNFILATPHDVCMFTISQEKKCYSFFCCVPSIIVTFCFE